MSYVIFGLNVPLLGMNRTCLVKIIHVWQKSHMFGKNHTCVEFTTQQDIFKMVGKKHTCVGKTTVNWHFNEVGKTKHVWILSNTYQIQRCVQNDTHV